MPTHIEKKMKTVDGKTCARLERKVDGKRKQGRGGFKGVKVNDEEF